MNPSFLKSVIILCVVAIICAPSAAAEPIYRFNGGPSGGTFMYFANAISRLAAEKDIKIHVSSSNGSVENIRATDSNRADFGIAYSGDIYLARRGVLAGDLKKYENVRVIAYLYSAPAQLAVRNDGTIKSLKDLEGKRIGVGDAASGAAFNAERLFSELNIWNKMRPQFIGYNNAASAFKNKQLDAFWVFSSYPNTAIYETALNTDIKLLDLWTETEEAGIAEMFPFYSKAVIPPRTYKGQTEPVNTVQDSAVWIASKNISEQTVYELLKTVYSDDGMKYMSGVHNSASAMTVANGIKGVVTPIHPGAEKFWKEKGILK